MHSNSTIVLFLCQDCIGGNCQALCKAKERCVQNCFEGRCPMRCVSDQCQQSCQMGECSLKCRTINDCEQQCSSDCPLVSCLSKEGSCKQVSKCMKGCFQLSREGIAGSRVASKTCSPPLSSLGDNVSHIRSLFSSLRPRILLPL